jgi:hypothetical protein
MENVDGFSVEREGNQIHISFFDIFGTGEVYTFPVEEARKILQGLEACIGPVDLGRWEDEGGSWLNDKC